MKGGMRYSCWDCWRWVAARGARSGVCGSWTVLAPQEQLEKKAQASKSKKNHRKISAAKAENRSSSANSQARKVEVTSKSVQAKGILYNNALQGQFKLLLKGHEPKLVRPELYRAVK